MTRRIHLLHPERGRGTFTDGRRFEVSWCGRIEPEGRMMLEEEDPARASCQRCAQALDRDAEPETFPSYLRARAYSRALSILRDRHRDEFEEILEEITPAVIAEERQALERDT